MRFRPSKRAGLYIVTLALISWLTGFAAFTFHITTLKEPAAGPADVIVVLTGGAGRISRGLDMLAAGKAEQLFITGVNDRVNMDAIMSLWRNENTDLVTCCVTLGHQAHNTRQNAQEARKWITGVGGIASARLVTSGYHMPRAMLEFRQALPGMAIVPAPVPYGAGPDHDRGNFWLLAFAEYNKTLLTWLRVTITPAKALPS